MRYALVALLAILAVGCGSSPTAPSSQSLPANLTATSFHVVHDATTIVAHDAVWSYRTNPGFTIVNDSNGVLVVDKMVGTLVDSNGQLVTNVSPAFGNPQTDATVLQIPAGDSKWWGIVQRWNGTPNGTYTIELTGHPAGGASEIVRFTYSLAPSL